LTALTTILCQYVSHEPIFQNIVLIYSFLILYHWKSNTMIHVIYSPLMIWMHKYALDFLYKDIRGERGCSGRVRSSCSTSGTRRVALVNLPLLIYTLTWMLRVHRLISFLHHNNTKIYKLYKVMLQIMSSVCPTPQQNTSNK